MQHQDAVEPKASTIESCSAQPPVQKAIKSKLIGVHCTARMVDAIDRYIDEHHGEMSRPEAIRQILRQVLLSRRLY